MLWHGSFLFTLFIFQRARARKLAQAANTLTG
jgi:hypothetical protein